MMERHFCMASESVEEDNTVAKRERGGLCNRPPRSWTSFVLCAKLAVLPVGGALLCEGERALLGVL